MKLTKPIVTSLLPLLSFALVLSASDAFEKIAPLPTPEGGAAPSLDSCVGGGFHTLEEMVKEFGRPESKLGAFVRVPTHDPTTYEDTTIHFSQSEEHNASVSYEDATTAVVVADGANYREGYCAAIYLVDVSGKPDSEIRCQMKDCLRRVGEGYSWFAGAEFVKLPQFPKPLLHISYYNGGRRVGNHFDEWFRIDRGKFESVLAMQTGRYCQPPYSQSRIGIYQETKFQAKGEKLIAKTERSIEPLDKPERRSKFETVFSWNKARGRFVAKDSRKLELRDLSSG